MYLYIYCDHLIYFDIVLLLFSLDNLIIYDIHTYSLFIYMYYVFISYNNLFIMKLYLLLILYFTLYFYLYVYSHHSNKSVIFLMTWKLKKGWPALMWNSNLNLNWEQLIAIDNCLSQTVNLNTRAAGCQGDWHTHTQVQIYALFTYVFTIIFESKHAHIN